MNKTDHATQAMILRCLTDGMSIRATSRTTGVSKGTVLRLLAEAGEFCAFYSCLRMRNIPSTRIQADEQWSFVGAKQKRAVRAGDGDLWTFVAIDADSKLVVTYLVGARNTDNTFAFIEDLSRRVSGRIQLSTDAWPPYLAAVRHYFPLGMCDYARLVKEYSPATDPEDRRRYSPPMCVAAHKVRMIGRPDTDHVSTSFVEALNLATRQHCKRFARLTLAHSKKHENHAHAVALHFFAHNFIRVHSSLSKARGANTTPAMAAGLTERPWTIEDMVQMMDPKTVTIK